MALGKLITCHVSTQGLNFVFRKLAVRAMRQLRVMDMYHASFVRYDEKTHRLLKACEPYISWGVPDVRTIRDLLTKRGFAVVGVSNPNSSLCQD